MNLLQVEIKLKAENIQSFIDDFLKIDGVVISDIQLYDDMILINKIKYKSFGTISIGLKLERVEDGILLISIKKLKAISIPISVVPVNFILKMVLNKLNVAGISSNGSGITVDLSTVFKEYNLDFVALDIKDIQITKENINVIVGNIDVDMVELMSKNKKSNENNVTENTKILKESNSPNIQNVELIQRNVVKVLESPSMEDSKVEEDFSFENDFYFENDFTKSSKGYFSEYSRVRDNLYNEKFKKLDKELLGKIIFILPDIGVLCYRLLRDKRVKRGIKILLVFTIAYLMNPVDLVNTKLSILNRIDDSLLLIFTLNKVFTSIDRRIIEYHFDGSEDTLNFLMDSFDVLNQFLGGERINKLYSVFEKFVR